MRTRLISIRYLFLFATLVGTIKAFAQVATPALSALSDNGKITLQILANSDLSTHFVPDGSSKVRLEFHFAPDDPRNGFYEATKQNGPVINGNVSQTLKFLELSYTSVDDLTFIATETLADSTVYEYKFHKGIYYREESATPVSACPVKIKCFTRGFMLIFDSDDFVVLPEHSTVPVTFFFGSGNPYNRHYRIHLVNTDDNSFIFSGLGSDLCETLFAGKVTITIGDMVCRYFNGELLSSYCSQMDPYYESDCMELLEGCQGGLTQVITLNKDWIQCKQWNDYGRPCNTDWHITRYGKVSIGVLGTSSSILTVKNGIISDKVFVSTCGNGGWCDYVFAPDYPLLPLSEVEKFIAEKRHLPGMPSAAEIESAGHFELGDITFRQQEKIEEIFLHLIEKDQEISTLETLVFLKELNQKTTTK